MVNWSKELLNHYLNQPYIFHLTKNSSELIRNVNDEISSLLKFNLYPVIFIITELIVIISIVSLLLFVDYKSVFICLIVLIFFGILYFTFFGPKIKSWGKQRYIFASTRYKNLIQALSGIKEIKLLNKVKFFLEKYVHDHKLVTSASRNYSIIQQTPRILIELLFLFLIVFFVFFNNYDKNSFIDFLPTLTIFFASAIRMIPSFNKMYQNLQFLKFGRPNLKKMYQEFSTIDRSKYHLKKNFVIDFKKKIQFKDVSFRYPNKENYVIKNLNFEIEKGKCIGIYGKSGSGKTTFVDLCMGLLTPESGEILVDKTNIQENLIGWHNILGHIPQEIYLTDDTIANNIAFGFNHNEFEKDQLAYSIKNAQLNDLISSLPDGINTYVGERGVQISGGEKQRIGIARALFNKSEVLIFDEATSALDQTNQEKIINWINTFKGKKTIILISHQPSVFKICDTVYELYENNLRIK